MVGCSIFGCRSRSESQYPNISFHAITLKTMEKVTSSTENGKYDIVWLGVFSVAFIQLSGIYGFYLFCTEAMWLTRLYTFCMSYLTMLGITAGAHRLWSHKTYKANVPLRIFLVILCTFAGQFSVMHWVRLHRIHHKYTDTDADPHNARRGFFFSHGGWLMVKAHPDYIKQHHTIDLSDISKDPILRFQKRYFKILAPLAVMVIPTYIVTLWGESLWNGFFVCAMCRYFYMFHATNSINSLAHLWGTKPYDKNIDPVENKFVSLATFGEGFHNYHHSFPFDYKAAELGAYSLNTTKLFIDVMAAIGWAYKLKTATTDMIQNRIKRTGDGRH